MLAAGCGGGERQDANEKSGNYDVDIVRASFPKSQRLAEQSRMRITVKNSGRQTIPDLAVTISDEKGDGAFAERSDQAGLADSSRPLWIVDESPRGGDTAYVGTWALGAVPAGKSRTFSWRVTATVAGQHTVTYRVAAGLNGKAKAQLASGGVPEGSITVNVSDKPQSARVDPDTGAVIKSDD